MLRNIETHTLVSQNQDRHMVATLSRGLLTGLMAAAFFTLAATAPAYSAPTELDVELCADSRFGDSIRTQVRNFRTVCDDVAVDGGWKHSFVRPFNSSDGVSNSCEDANPTTAQLFLCFGVIERA